MTSSPTSSPTRRRVRPAFGEAARHRRRGLHRKRRQPAAARRRSRRHGSRRPLDRARRCGRRPAPSLSRPTSATLVTFSARARYDGVLHFAAKSLVGESMVEPSLYWHNNVGGSRDLLDAVTAHGVPRFVFSSTAAVYGEPDEVPIRETATHAADERLRRDEAGRRSDDPRRGGRTWSGRRQLAILQRRRSSSRRGRTARDRNASDSDRARRRRWPAPCARYLRHRLADSRRHLHSRLRSRRRSRSSTPARTARSA